MAICFNEHELKLINGGFNYWSNSLPVNRDVIISFINGIELMMKNNDQLAVSGQPYSISGLMSSYLWNKYKIKHLTLERTLNHLAVIEQKDWMEIFLQIFDDFQKEINWDMGFAKIERDSIFEMLTLKKVENGVDLNELKCQNGEKIQIGSIIQLGNLMKEDYRNTLFFDADLECPEWDALIPSKKSFRFINFFHENTTFGNVVGAYSLMTTRVTRIYRLQDQVFIQSEHFEIEFEAALRNSELLVGQNIIENNNQEWQELNMVKFQERAGSYILGVMTDEELWTGIIGFDIYAPFYGRKEKKSPKIGYYGTSIKTRWSTKNNP